MVRFIEIFRNSGKKNIPSIVAFFAVLGIFWITSVQAQTITLRRIGNFSNPDVINVGDTLEIGVYVDSREYQIFGYQIYLTFYDEYFKILDADSGVSYIQPFVEGSLLNQMNADHNDTEGDLYSGSDNGKSGFQMRYSKILGANAQPFQGADFAASFKLLSRKATPENVFTRITIDNEQYEFRETAVYYKSGDLRLSKKFQSKNDLNVFITGSSIGLPPKIELSQEVSQVTLNLDDFVNTPDLNAEQLLWSVSETDIAQITIDNNTRTATITRIPGKGGVANLTFTATAPGGEQTPGFTTLVILAPPYFEPKLPDVTFAEDSSAVLDLSAYVVDPDGASSGISFEVVYAQDLNVSLSGNTVSFSAGTNWYGERDSIIFKATDDEQLSVYDTIKVTVTAVNDPPVLESFDNIYVPPGEKTTIYVRPKVTDVDNDYSEMAWTSGTADNFTMSLSEDGDSLIILSNNSSFTGYEKIYLKVADPDGLYKEDSLFVYSQEPVIELIFPDSITITEDTRDTLSLFSYLNTFLEYTGFVWSVDYTKNVTVTIFQDSTAILDPPENWFGADSLILTLEDNDGILWKDTVTVIVEPVNDPPKISGLPDLFAPPDKKITLNLSDKAVDIDNDQSELAWETGTSTNFDLSINAATNILSCSLKVAEWNGSENILLKVKDPGNLADSAFIKITADSGTAPVNAAISISLDSIEFGMLNTADSIDTFFTILNYGTADLEISDIVSLHDAFSVNKTTYTIPYGNVDTVFVTFSPTYPGAVDTVISIISNDPANPEITVSVSGTGFENIGPAIQISTAPLNFGVIELGTSSQKSVPVQNVGDEILNINSITVNNSAYTVDKSSLILSPDESSSLLITFIPELEQEENAQLRIQSDAGNSPDITINIVGEGRVIDYTDTVQVVSIYSGNPGDYESQVLYENQKYNLSQYREPLDYLNGGSFLFPAGSLVENAVLIINAFRFSSNQAVHEKEMRKYGYISITGFELSVNDKVFHPVLPVEVQIPYDEETVDKYGLSESKLLLGYYVSPGVIDTSGISDVSIDSANNLITGKISYFREIAVTGIEVLTGEYKLPPVPGRFQLYQNYPNPFNSSTSIEFDLPIEGKLTLEIFDILGRRVRLLSSGHYSPGEYNVQWDGRDDTGRRCSSGIYFYRLSSQINSSVLKLILLN